VTTFGTQRIALTSPNRRVVPMTRDYQYVAARFFDYSQPAAGQEPRAGFTAPVSYVDYVPDIDDVLALCITGFPRFDSPAGQRRSLIYVGPANLRAPADRRPDLFSADRVTDLADTAGVQVNAIVTRPGAETVNAVADNTGGRSATAGPDLTAQLDAIRNNPPTAMPASAAATRRDETPDVPLALAMFAVTGLAITRVVLR
jgi:hypothetical protein